MSASESKPVRHWTAGRPVFGLHVRGVGLTRNALLPLGWAAVPWGIGLVMLVRFVTRQPGTPEVTERLAVIPAPFTAVPMIFAFALGVALGVVALTTYRAWGRQMTTRYRGPEAAPEPRTSDPSLRLR